MNTRPELMYTIRRSERELSRERAIPMISVDREGLHCTLR